MLVNLNQVEVGKLLQVLRYGSKKLSSLDLKGLESKLKNISSDKGSCSGCVCKTAIETTLKELSQVL